MLTTVACCLGAAVFTAGLPQNSGEKKKDETKIELNENALADFGLLQVPRNTKREDGTTGPPLFDKTKHTKILVHGFMAFFPNPDIFNALVEELSATHNMFVYEYDSGMLPAFSPGKWVHDLLEKHVNDVKSPELAGGGLATAVLKLDQETDGTLSAKGLTMDAHSLGVPVARYSSAVRGPDSDIPTLANSNIPIDLVGITGLLHGMGGMEGRAASAPVNRFFTGITSFLGSAVIPAPLGPWDYSGITNPDSEFLTAPTGNKVTIHLGPSDTDGTIKRWAQDLPESVGRPATTFTLTGDHNTVLSAKENARIIAEKNREVEKRRDSMLSGSATGTSGASTGESSSAAPGAAPPIYDGMFYPGTPRGPAIWLGPGFGPPSGPWFFNPSSATSGQNDLRTQLMILFQLLLNAQAQPNRDDAAWVPSSPLASRFSLATMLFAAQATRAAAPPIKLALSALGVSSGTAFEIRAINEGDLPVSGSALGVVVEPLTAKAGEKVVEDFGRASRNHIVQTSTADAYCLERERESPEKATTFRVAAPDIQQRFQPMRHVLQAAKTLEDRGALNPQGDRMTYIHFIRQWSIWAREGRFNESRFVEALVAHAKKNMAGARRPWTREIEESVKGSAPHRWRDIDLVLQEAARLDAAARP